MKSLPAFLTTCAAALLFSSQALAADPIRIGQAIDLSGPNGSLGRDYVAGIRTCFDMINAAGGINGRKLSYAVHDDRGDPQAAAQLAGDLIRGERVDVLLGGVGEEALQRVLASPAFRNSGHLLYAPLAGSETALPESEAARVLFWRPGYLQEVRHVLSHFANIGVKRLALAVQEAPAAQRAAQAVTTELQARGMQVAASARIGADGERLAPEAARIAAAKPAFVLVIADTIGTAQFLKEFRRHDAQTFVAGTSLVNLDTLRELAGARAIEWTVFSQVVPSPSSATSMLQIEHLKMMRKFRDEPVSALTLEGFAVAKALVLALQRAKPREDLRASFARLGTVDLGGMAVTVGTATGTARMSNYLDIALFRRGGGLVF